MHDPTITQSGITRMHRVRVGLIGLAWVFLLVMLATTFLHIAGGDLVSTNSAALTNDAAPNEPLAELGVAPGNPDQGGAAPVGTRKDRSPVH
jgi:hypothetical protein